MNALGLLLLGSIAHATAFAIAGIGTYLAIRRWGPAAGSLAAGSSLFIMALVSIVVLSPWPRWWTLAMDRPAVGVSRPDLPAEIAAEASTRGQGDASTRRGTSPAPKVEALAAQPSLFALVLDELRRPSGASGSASWGWREWLAVGFLASALLGLGRLGIGLWGIARLRARSRPIDDPELDDMLQLLRAELSCTRNVELRELAELTTPATIGWRRPVLFLPADWRSWDAEERRAVLAHELAHVSRGDFAAGVAAQLAVALHFYHPLAHWLAARLRLEQELAADAWGARLSGGKPSYLATLARMALRRDGRAITWPARAFLPSHGTFVRRIEMLKNHGPIRHVTLPLAARVSTIAAFAAIGLLIAGLRGPVGELTTLAQDRPIKPAAGEAGSYNLAFLPADARMVVAVRPGGLLGRRDIRMLLDSIHHGPMGGDRLPVAPEDVEQLLVFWESGPAEGGPGHGGPMLSHPSGFVVRLNKPQDWKALLSKLVGPRLAEARHDGQAYFRLEDHGPMSWGVYAPDDRTVVAAEEVVLRDLIAERNAPAPRHPWDEAWKKVTKGQVMMALDTRWLRRLIGRAQPGRPHGEMVALETFAPLYEKADSYAASLDVTDRSLAIDLAAESGSAENAKAVADTLQAVLTLGKNALQGLRRDLVHPGSINEAHEWLLQSADSLLARTKVETTEGSVRMHGEASVDLAEGIRLLVPAVSSARVAARRAQSANNLKQIGLAFHNYNFSTKHFPAAVNRGGKDKSIPYSWRVAILPYIEQQELYNEYNFDEPWDGPNNRKLIDKMPTVYASPVPDGSPSSRSHTSYFVFTGPSTTVGAGDEPEIQKITDGTSNTFLAVEAKRDIPWTKPEDIPFDPKAPLPELGGFTPDGFNAAFCDGSVRYIKKSINPMTLKALITRDGGEVVSSDSY
jgi:prepilin-type processing-associated H-X9-DG protein